MIFLISEWMNGRKRYTCTEEFICWYIFPGIWARFGGAEMLSCPYEKRWGFCHSVLQGRLVRCLAVENYYNLHRRGEELLLFSMVVRRMCGRVWGMGNGDGSRRVKREKVVGTAVYGASYVAILLFLSEENSFGRFYESVSWVDSPAR